MRISLLLAREPFAQILEKTLARFWSNKFGGAVQVSWIHKRPHRALLQQRDPQVWLANIYLNAIFIPNIDALALEPIRREFSHSPRWWRRPFQQAYVAFATSPLGAAAFSQARLEVTPGVPDAQNKLIVAGNHKIRILDHESQVAYSLLKDNFEPHFWEQELAARQTAARLGLPVPPLEMIAEDRTWFAEKYISGTPLNRLPDREMAHQASRQAISALKKFTESTLEEIPLGEYTNFLRARIEALVEANQLLTGQEKADLLAITETVEQRIHDRLPALSDSFMTAMTHGDFQPANLLLNDDGIWFIDWEYANRRQAGYDLLVFALGSRFPRGLAARLADFSRSGITTKVQPFFDHWPGINWAEAANRQIHAHIFALEELALHLEENANPCFTSLGLGLKIIRDEINAWLVNPNL